MKAKTIEENLSENTAKNSQEVELDIAKIVIENLQNRDGDMTIEEDKA